MEKVIRRAGKPLYGAGLVILLSMGGLAFGAEPPAFSNEWFRCEADSDCVHIQYSCVDVAVNQAYAKPANGYYEFMSARVECAGPPPRERGKDVPDKVDCEARQCKVRGTSPKKPGPSQN